MGIADCRQAWRCQIVQTQTAAFLPKIKACPFQFQKEQAG
jgi:hypothetical protein